MTCVVPMVVAVGTREAEQSHRSKILLCFWRIIIQRFFYALEICIHIIENINNFLIFILGF
jgi:hypothetical protein